MKIRQEKIQQKECIEKIAEKVKSLEIKNKVKQVTLYSDRFEINHNLGSKPPRHNTYLGKRRKKKEKDEMMTSSEMEKRVKKFKKKAFKYAYINRDCVLTTLTTRDDQNIFLLQKYVRQFCNRLRKNFYNIEYICKYEKNKRRPRFHVHIMLIFNGKKPRVYTKK